MKLLELTLILAFVPSTSPAAQANDRPPVAAPRIFADSFGLTHLDGAWIGAGPGYVVHFEPGGPRFFPTLGPGAPSTRELGFRLEILGREDGETLRVDSPAAPRGEGSVAIYDRALGVSERYELTTAGVEQSFVIPKRLAGSGDLVVRGRLETDFEVVAVHGSGYALTRSDGNGLTIGGVTGIDARGARADGTLNIEDGYLELRLPASFADGAHYPLVVDPLFGPLLTIGGTLDPDRDPDCTCGENFGYFLVVWEKVLSSTSSMIVGQKLDLDGVLVGGLHAFSGSTSKNIDPAAAYIEGESRFVVVWEDDGGVLPGSSAIRARGTLNSGTPFLTNSVVVDSGASAELGDADIGGSPDSSGSTGLIVWTDSGGSISARTYTLNASTLTVGAWSKITSPGFFETDSQPRLTTHGDTTSVYGITWRRSELPFIGPSPEISIRARLVDDSGFVHGPEVVVASSTTVDLQRPDIDGANQEYVVAWDQPQPIPLVFRRIHARPVRATLAGMELAGPAQILAGSAFAETTEPRVAYGQGKTWVQFAQKFGSSYSIRAKDIGASTCISCGNTLLMGDLGTTKGDGHAIAGVWNLGFNTKNRLLSVWGDSIFGAGEQVNGQVLDSFPTGSTTNLGGGCGLGGTAMVFDHSQISIGHPALQVALNGAPTTAHFSILNLNVPGPPFNCGTCAITPYLIPIIVAAGPGFEIVEFAVPCDFKWIGKSIEVQWTTSTPGLGACVPDFSLSNRLLLNF